MGLELADLAAAGVVAAGATLSACLWKATPWLLGSATSAASGVFPAMVASSPVLLGLARWQWLSIGAFAVNMASVSVPGRIDNRMAKEAKDMREKGASKEDAPGVPRDSRYRSLVTPAGWAFAIWGAIFSGETIFTAFQALPSAPPVMAGVAPWFAAACGLQALWCVAFREWISPPRRFWLSPALLAATGLALGGAHSVLRAAVTAGELTTASYMAAHVPLSLHFGWITAASVVSLNSFFALTLPPPAQLAAAFTSVLGSALLGSAVTITSGDPLYAATLAWALAGVAADKGWRAREVVGELPLQALTLTATTASRALLVVAAGAAVLSAV